MKLQILADPHFEFMADQGRSFIKMTHNDADLTIIAGDLTNAQGMADALDQIGDAFREVIYVPGNHDYYMGSFELVRNIFAKAPSNVHVLDNSSITIENIIFIGATLWFREMPEHIFLRSRLSDFNYIRDFPTMVYEENHEAMEFIASNAFPASVVITHHAPSPRSVPERFKNSSINTFFVCDMEKTIVEKQPWLWIHGHTHDSFDYRIENTRVICNPFGYVKSDENPNFDPKLSVMVGSSRQK